MSKLVIMTKIYIEYRQGRQREPRVRTIRTPPFHQILEVLRVEWRNLPQQRNEKNIYSIYIAFPGVEIEPTICHFYSHFLHSALTYIYSYYTCYKTFTNSSFGEDVASSVTRRLASSFLPVSIYLYCKSV